MKPTIRPLKNDVILRTIRPQGLIIVDPMEEKYPNKGEIVFIGKDVNHLKPGDKVAFTKFPKTDWKEDGNEYLLHDADDILAII
jgi:co-chaperonin GroES (HSP10)